MPALQELITQLTAGAIEVVDLTAPLSERTPVISLPADLGQAWPCPAVVLDFSREAAADPDFLLERRHVEDWQDRHGPLPVGGWLLYHTGWDERGDDPARFLNDGHTPGIEASSARWLAEETPIIGIGVETVGTDAGLAASFSQPFPCHWHLQGAGKYGLTQLRNLARLPVRGAVVVAAPLPIVRGSGSPARVLALTETEGR